MAEHGLRPIELLAETGCLGSHSTVVHATHANGRELDLLAEAGARVCVCPTTEANLGDGFVAAEEICERGIGICIGSDSNVRIDPLEELRELEGVARRLFAPGEHRALCRLPAPARLRGFFECWTRKEAVVKALGVGLSVPLDSFEVAFGRGVAPGIARIDLDAPPPSAWSLVDLEPLEGVIGAVAAPFEVRGVEGVMLS